MTKIEIGGLIALLVAVATASVYIGALQGRVSILETAAANLNNQVVAIQQLDLKGTQEQLEEAIKKYSPMPSKAILAWAGQPDEMPAGWVVCGQKETLNLDGQFLIGTNDWSEIGHPTGNKTHQHGVAITSGWEHGGQRTKREGADNFTGDPNWNHKHQVHGETQDIEHIPPSVKVFFLCKE